MLNNSNTKWDIRDTIFVILIGILIIAAIIKGCKGDEKDKVINNNPYIYKTDTIKSTENFKELYDKMVKKLDEKSNVTPTKTVIYYQTPNPKNISIEKIPDSLLVYIDSLKNKIAISDAYIKNFPKNDKLITMGLEKNNLNITTLDIEGKTKTQEYPLYLDKFGYQWYDNSLHHYEVKQRKDLKNVFNQFYIYGGYNVISKTPNLGAEYFILLKRFKLGANANVTFEKQSMTNFGFTLGYRVF